MRNVKLCLLILFCLFIVGCASAPPAKLLGSEFYNDKAQTVGVYISYPEKADTYLPGATCLLCMGVAAAANGELTTHIEKLSTDEFASLPRLVQEKLQNYGIDATLISRPVNLERLRDFNGDGKYAAEKDFRFFKHKYNIATLIVIDIHKMGAVRTYNAYVPTSDPKGYVSGRVFAVDLDSNLYGLYQPIEQRVAVEGKWDEPPRFPGVTNAFFKAIAKTKTEVLSFFEQPEPSGKSTVSKTASSHTSAK